MLPGQDSLRVFSLEELKHSQEFDPIISKLLPFVLRNHRPSRRERSGLDAKVMVLIKQWERLKVQNGVLYRVTKDNFSKQKRHQYVLPDSLKEKALHGIHDVAGHQGQARTLHLARQRFFWPKMESDVLVLTDHFTKLAHAFPCTNQTAKQVAKKLWDHVFCVYGFPECVHSDQGAHSRIAQTVRSLQITHYCIPSNGKWRNGKIQSNTWEYAAVSLSKRETQVASTDTSSFCTFAYNATVHETTGYALFQLMFGRTPRLPVDVMFKQVLHDPVVVDYKSYAKTLMSDLHEAARIAQEHSIKEQDKQASGYNRKVRGTHLNLGDRVLIANKGERGKKKLADKWSAIVYTVKDRNLQTHTYKLVDSSETLR